MDYRTVRLPVIMGGVIMATDQGLLDVAKPLPMALLGTDQKGGKHPCWMLADYLVGTIDSLVDDLRAKLERSFRAALDMPPESTRREAIERLQQYLTGSGDTRFFAGKIDDNLVEKVLYSLPDARQKVDGKISLRITADMARQLATQLNAWADGVESPPAISVPFSELPKDLYIKPTVAKGTIVDQKEGH